MKLKKFTRSICARPKKAANSKMDEPSAFDSMGSTFIKQKIILEKPK